MSGARIRHYLSAERLPGDDAARLQRARQMGFDTDTVWYHGTTAQFKTYRVARGGNELGDGMYLTRSQLHARAWARGPEGRVLECFIRRGDYLDYSKVQAPPVLRDMHRRHGAALRRKWGDGDEYSLPEFKEFVLLPALERGMDALSSLARTLGYLGAVDPRSQIPDQVVVFDPRNVRAVTAKFDPAKAGTANLFA